MWEKPGFYMKTDGPTRGKNPRTISSGKNCIKPSFEGLEMSKEFIKIS